MTEIPDYARDTIVAPATPPGKGAIGIVRISGPDAGAIGTAMLGALPAPRVAALSTFLDAAGEPVDSGLALWFPDDASYTGEPVLELQGHGGPVVMSLLVETAVALGARRAEPGEFSRRAFLNGKLDLSQAEAVADLIDAGSRQAARAALRSLSGAFSDAVNALAADLTTLRLHVEAAIDFPDEDIDFLADDALRARIEQCAAAFDHLQHAAGAGRVLVDGYRVVILGPPNAGKSSLMNRLSGDDTAIVTDVAGTTRDVLRERIDIDGIAVEIVDTAGLREDPDRIEAEGIRRARKALADADAVVWLTDASLPGTTPPDATVPAGLPVVEVRNKVDLTAASPGLVSESPPVVALSALTGEGIDALRELIRRLAGAADAGEGAFTARQRHLDALAEARRHFEAGRTALETLAAGELLAEELRSAHAALSSITGEFTPDDLLGRIFSTFCIGK